MDNQTSLHEDKQGRGTRRTFLFTDVTHPTPKTTTIVVGVLATAMWGVVLLGFGRLFLQGPWLMEAFTVGAATLLLACFASVLIPKRRILAIASGTIGGFLCWFAWQGGTERPSLWVHHPSEMLDEVAATVSTEVAPFAPYGAFEDALGLIVLIIAILCTFLLIGGDNPVIATTVLALLMLVPTVITGVRTPGALVLVAGIILAALVWITSPQPSGSGLVAVGVSVAVAAGIVAVAPATRDKMWNQSFLPAPVSTDAPDVTVTLAQDLRSRSTTPAFDYNGSSQGGYRFALTTLVDFTDGHWLPDDEMPPTRTPVHRLRTSDSVTPSTAVLGAQETSSQQVKITIRGLLSEWLPLPQSALQVTSGNEDTAYQASLWLWTANAATALSPADQTKTGDQYVVIANPLIYENLQGVSIAESAPYESIDQAPEELQRYLELPDPVPALISETAHQIAGGASDRFSIATALQSWFRSGDFVYDESAPYIPGADSGDPYAVIQALLAQKHGFCVHYASAFAVMARELGLPTRLSVGYASRSDGASTVTVLSGDLHAWPEVYIDDLGWAAFEPTPGGAGMRADTGEDVAPEPEQPSEEQSSEQADTPETVPDLEQSSAQTSPEQGTSEPSQSGPWWLLLLVLLLLVVPAGLRSGKTLWRRVAILRGIHPAESAWDEFRDTAVDLGLVRTNGDSSMSPRAHTAEALVEYLEVEGVLEGRSSLAARRLASAMGAERYGSARNLESGTNLITPLNIAISRLRDKSGPAARIRARLLPHSLAHTNG